jgi:hypothetical protein
VEYGTFKYIITIPSSGITTQKIYSSDIQNYQTNYRTDYDVRYEYEYTTNNGSMWRFSVIHVDGALVQGPTGSSPIYAYQITDHLGNVRYISKNGRTLYALYAYYPYGGEIPENSISRDSHSSVPFLTDSPRSTIIQNPEDPQVMIWKMCWE